MKPKLGPQAQSIAEDLRTKLTELEKADRTNNLPYGRKVFIDGGIELRKLTELTHGELHQIFLKILKRNNKASKKLAKGDGDFKYIRDFFHYKQDLIKKENGN